jgi:hypothetical protein
MSVVKVARMHARPPHEMRTSTIQQAQQPAVHKATGIGRTLAESVKASKSGEQQKQT